MDQSNSNNNNTNVTTTTMATTTTTTTRKTRMIFVEEISDTERINETSSCVTTPGGGLPEAETAENDMEARGEESSSTGGRDRKLSFTGVPPDGVKIQDDHVDNIGGTGDPPTDINDTDLVSTEKERTRQANAAISTSESFPSKMEPANSGLFPIREEGGGSVGGQVTAYPRLARLVPEVTRAERARQAFKAKGRKSHRALQNLDDLKTIQDTLMYETLRPLLRCMKISGIFFVRKKGTFGRSVSERIRACTALHIYCALMCLVLLLNCLKSVFAFDGREGFGSLLFAKFLTTIFAYESMSRALLAFWGCARREKGFAHIFLAMDKICYTDNIMPYEQPMKRTMNYLIALSFVMSVANVATSAYGLFGENDSRYDFMLRPVPADLPAILVFKIFLLFMIFINGLVAMLSLSFFTCICYCLYKEFEYFSRTFSMKIKEDGSFTDDLERFRRNHQRRCKIVEDSNYSFKYYIANTYLTNVPLVCLLLYSIVYSTDDKHLSISYQLINVFKLLYVFLQMITVSIAATLINNQAHSPLVDMYNLRVSNFPMERQLEVNMFLNKLTGTEIGLTAWDMFVINKPAVLTVIGMMLTYFFLLVQFRIPLLSPVECRCEMWTNDSSVANLFKQEDWPFTIHHNLTLISHTQPPTNGTSFWTDTNYTTTTTTIAAAAAAVNATSQSLLMTLFNRNTKSPG